MHHVAPVGRIRDDCVGRAVMVERKRILTGADVTGADAAQAKPFEMPHQCAAAGTGLGEAAHATEVRNQGRTAACGVG